MAYDTQPAELIHSVTKAMMPGYDPYKDAAPGAVGLELKRQNLAVGAALPRRRRQGVQGGRRLERGDEAHNQMLIKRQDTLVEAWKAFLKTNPPEDKAAFTAAWMASRKAALAKAGLDPIFE